MPNKLALFDYKEWRDDSDGQMHYWVGFRCTCGAETRVSVVGKRPSVLICSACTAYRGLMDALNFRVGDTTPFFPGKADGTTKEGNQSGSDNPDRAGTC